MPEPTTMPAPYFPCKGADGKMYKTPQEAQATYGIPSDRQSQWILIMHGLFEPIHYAYVFDGTETIGAESPNDQKHGNLQETL
jgi:hypothetical protein